jgi:hypothetical protein
MTVNTINKNKFLLLSDSQIVVACLLYNSSSFDDAMIEAGEKYLLNGIATGTWVTYPGKDNSVKLSAKIKVETGGVISIGLPGKKRKYFFKKSTGWKLRFYLTNKEGEDLLTLIPNINWQKESHDFNLQLNEEYEKECDSFLILHAVHCANCSLSMMTGGKVPALVSL